MCCFWAWIPAQALEPPAWSVGDWWIVKNQVYDSGKVMSGGAQPGWRSAQTWRFDVEDQEFIESQPHFVVSIRPLDDNPSPYWFRCWFRASDRYVARYELHHSTSPAERNIRALSAPTVRKNFNPAHAAPFVTSTFPALPLAVPVFVDEAEWAPLSLQESTIRSQPSAHTSPEFETTQTIHTIGTRGLSEEETSGLSGMIRGLSAGQDTAITIRTTSSVVEVQYWDPQLPWCVYGKRIEQDSVSRRYWLVEVGRK
jgi:hypothetical protein